MSSPLMISVAGVRGIVGDSLTEPVVARFSAAFARELPDGPIVIGRDARRSGPMISRAAISGLIAAGRDVVDLGLATTPTTEIAVEHLRAAGGVIVTASHNPSEWNALKFLNARGEFLSSTEGAAVRERFERGAEPPAVTAGTERTESSALDWHLERVLGLDVIDLAMIRARRLRVVVDGCASVGGLAVPPLLKKLGAEVIELDCEPTGNFTRELEPLPEHLGALGNAVRQNRADFGIALDPDADRAAFVDAQGVPLGEEFTVALGVRCVLAKHRGPVVTNLSTSLILEAVCHHSGVPLHRTKVGEAHVVARMRAEGAIAGGEGNGGMILPAAHYGRDGLVAAALIAELVSSSGRSLRELANELPRTSMIKRKLDRPAEAWPHTAERLKKAFAGMTLDEADGLRFSGEREWVHVRASGTEPVVRVIAESEDEERTRSLVARASHALEDAKAKGNP